MSSGTTTAASRKPGTEKVRGVRTASASRTSCSCRRAGTLLLPGRAGVGVGLLDPRKGRLAQRDLRIDALPAGKLSKVVELPAYGLSVAGLGIAIRWRVAQQLGHLRRPLQGRQRVGHSLVGRPFRLFATLLPFARLYRLPVTDHLVGVRGSGVGEHMRMPPYQLVDYGRLHLLVIERALLLGDDRVEGDLEEHVPQLVDDRTGITRSERIDRLTRLLEQVLPERGMGLLAVPGAAVRCPQDAHYLQ